MAKKKIVSIFKDYDPLWKYVRGVGNWNALIEPDDYEKWSTNLSGPEVDELEDELQAFLDDAVQFVKEEGKVVESIAPIFKETQEGNKYIQFKKTQYEEDTDGPKLYNVTGEEITGKLKREPGGGSTLRVKAMIKPYYMATTKTVGLSYKLLAVQIIEAKEYAGSSGFGDESNGETPPFDADVPADY